MKEQVEGILGHFKPFFHAHGGDFEIREVTDDGVVKVDLVGDCILCVLQDKTAAGMEDALRNAGVAGFDRVEVVEQ